MITLTLPYPPTNNHIYKHANGVHYITRKGKQYFEDVKWIVLSEKANVGLSHRLNVSVIANPPDKRKCDLDNLFKAILDSLTKSGVIEDDSLIDKLSIVRGDVIRGGQVVINIKEA